MSLLQIKHRTVYRYRQPVTFGEHRLMFRPRDSHDLRHVSSTLSISPKADVRWKHDVFGNSIAVATFTAGADELVFDSDVTVEQFAAQWPVFPIAPRGQFLPVNYTTDERDDLGRSAFRHYPDDDGGLEAWARSFLSSAGSSDTLSVLRGMNETINKQFAYVERLDEGTQPPAETLRLKQGSCRDFALLMMEAARTLGIASRFVTGYLFDPADGQGGIRGAGATHAWMQTYLPGSGWIEFDPTNGIVGGNRLIRVAVTRDPSQAIPITGTFFGAADDFIDLEVDVSVTSVERAGPASAA